MKQKEIQSLITLLDDSNVDISKTVENKLICGGSKIIPELETRYESANNPIIQRKIETVINRIQSKNIADKLNAWSLFEEHNLLRGVYLVAKYEYSDLEYDNLQLKIANIAEDAWIKLDKNLTALEKVRVLNHLIFNIHKFKANKEDFYAPQNSFLNRVLDTHKANPISLAVVYLLIAEMLNLPIFGVNLHKNFILCFVDNFSKKTKNKVLFYINPYNKGTIFGRKEILHFLTHEKLSTNNPQDFEPTSNKIIVERMIYNLMIAYKEKNKMKKFYETEEIYDSF